MSFKEWCASGDSVITSADAETIDKATGSDLTALGGLLSVWRAKDETDHDYRFEVYTAAIIYAEHTGERNIFQPGSKLVADSTPAKDIPTETTVSPHPASI